jgi:hypothetical protein
MDFSKLGQNEKLAVYGAIAAIVGPLLSSVGFGFGMGGLTLLLAIAMLAIVFMPQLSPQTSLPGSKGSLMLLVGGIAAASAALALIGSLGWLGFFGSNPFFVLGWLIGIAGGLLMGWAGWQEFQAEGGKFQVGSATGSGATAAAARPSEGAAPSAPQTTSEAEARAAAQAEARTATDAAEPPSEDRPGQP